MPAEVVGVDDGLFEIRYAVVNCLAFFWADDGAAIVFGHD